MPSSSAPKQKPITTSTTRRSLGRWSMHPGAEGVEPAGPHGDVVEQQRVDHDPHHRPKREDGAVGDRVERQPDRHLPDGDRDDQGDDEAGQRGLPRRAAQARRAAPEPRRSAGPRRRNDSPRLSPTGVKSCRNTMSPPFRARRANSGSLFLTRSPARNSAWAPLEKRTDFGAGGLGCWD